MFINSENASQKWFVKLFAPWCRHCKLLRPVWDALSAELREHDIRVAEVDCTLNGALTCERFTPDGYPTLIFIEDGKFHRYNGARELEALKAYALQAEKPGLEELPSTVSHMDSWLGVMPNILRSFATEFD